MSEGWLISLGMLALVFFVAVFPVIAVFRSEKTKRKRVEQMFESGEMDRIFYGNPYVSLYDVAGALGLYCDETSFMFMKHGYRVKGGWIYRRENGA